MTEIIIPPSSPEALREQYHHLSVKHIEAKANIGFEAKITKKALAYCVNRAAKRDCEHGLHGIGYVGGRIGRKEKSRRGALLQLGRNGGNDRIDLAVFIVREARVRIGDRLIGYIKNGNRNPAIF
jgi:hypothetical protein